MNPASNLITAAACFSSGIKLHRILFSIPRETLTYETTTISKNLSKKFIACTPHASSNKCQRDNDISFKSIILYDKANLDLQTASQQRSQET